MKSTPKPLPLTPTLARRLAVTRQRLAGPQPPPNPAGIMEIARALGCLQLDPISTVARSHLLVLWSRLGPYNPAHLDTLLWTDHHLFEYWAHAASIVLTDDYPLHYAHMRGWPNSNAGWSDRVRAWLVENEPFRRYVLNHLSEHGPTTTGQFENRAVTNWRSDGWNADRNVGQMVSFLWSMGDIMVAKRQGIHRYWDLTKRCLPPNTPREELPPTEVTRQAVPRALRALGMATAKQIKAHFIRDRYHLLDKTLQQLTAAGQITPVEIVENGAAWPDQWYIHTADLPLLERLAADPAAWQPRTTLLSPFDNLICDRVRTETLFNFSYRTEIYTPKAKRQYGYYVMPILHGDTLIGRLDPKLDRQQSRLVINAIHAEPDAPHNVATVEAIAATIKSLAVFLEANTIDIAGPLPAMWEKLKL